MAEQMKKTMPFEDGLKRLEEIAQTLENGDLPLADALKLYKEGVELSALCEKKLKEAEQTITQTAAEETPVKDLDNS